MLRVPLELAAEEVLDQQDQQPPDLLAVQEVTVNLLQSQVHPSLMLVVVVAVAILVLVVLEDQAVAATALMVLLLLV